MQSPINETRLRQAVNLSLLQSLVDSSFKFCLVGNNIPQDVIQALSVAIQQNSDRQVTFEEHRLKTEALTRELEMVEERKRQEVCISYFCNKIESQPYLDDASLLLTVAYNFCKLCTLLNTVSAIYNSCHSTVPCLHCHWVLRHCFKILHFICYAQ